MDLSPSPSVDVGTNQDSIGSPSVGDSLNQELEPVVPCITLELEGGGGEGGGREEEEEEEEEQMAPNLRVYFKERQRKRHFEALLTTPLPAKKTPPKVSRKELVLDASMV